MTSIQVAKRIADPVYGTIGLTKLETQVIDTAVFQRLRNIKHLGLAHLVYPAADFSRFAHSLGVCHVTGRLLDALRVVDPTISDEDIKRYRVAGLLHDIGHYPLSHALEDSVKNHLRTEAQEALLEGSIPLEIPSVGTPTNAELDHEYVGEIILAEDSQLRAVLQNDGIDPEDISGIFTRRPKEVFGVEDIAINPLVNLVSSDLDADRIDYLLRSSTSTGLPYGSVDLEYIISQIQIDDEKRVCLHERAMRTADHLLLARFFDTQAVALHKTVAALETLAQDIVSQLLSLKKITINEEWIREKIRANEWSNFDDAWLMSVMTEAAREEDEQLDPLLKMKILALLERRPPKLVASREYFRRTNDEPMADNHYKRIVREYKTAVEEAETKFDLKGHFLVWDFPSFKLNKSSGLIPSDALDQAGAVDDDKLVQSVRILPRVRKERISRPIMSQPNSLMNILSNYALDSVRLYFLEPVGDSGDKSSEVRSWLQERLGA